MATLNENVNELTRWKIFAEQKIFIGDVLRTLMLRDEKLTRAEINEYALILDANRYNVTDANLLGLYMFGGIRYLRINPSRQSGLTAESIDITNFNQIQYVLLENNTYPLFGIWSTKTTLIDFRINVGTTFLSRSDIPIVSNNLGLVTFILKGNGFATSGTTVGGQIFNLGNLQNNINLVRYEVTGSVLSTAIVDNILATLLTAKQNGGALTTVNLSSTSIPTGGNNNTSAVALRALGVTVTVRTV